MARFDFSQSDARLEMRYDERGAKDTGYVYYGIGEIESRDNYPIINDFPIKIEPPSSIQNLYFSNGICIIKPSKFK